MTGIYYALQSKALVIALVATSVVCLQPNTASSEPLLLMDVRGLKISVDDRSPCPNENYPVILDSQASAQFDDTRGIWGPLGRARMELDFAQICRFSAGQWVHFEGRVRGVPVNRGRAEIMNDMGWTGQIEVESISSILPPESSLSTFLSGKDPQAPLPLDELAALYEASTDPAERREIAYLIGSGAMTVRQRSQEEQDFMVAFLERAAAAGHPIAMFNLSELSGLPELIYEATANVPTSGKALEKLDTVLPTIAGTYLFQSAEANYGQALRTLQRAKTFGLRISRDGVTLADTPTLHNVDAAVNAHLQANSFGSFIPAGVAIQNCDGTWCYVIGGSKFRITVDGVACNATGSGAAQCAVTARFILTNDFGNNAANWQASFMSMTSNAAPFNFSADLVVEANKWKVVRMQGDN